MNADLDVAAILGAISWPVTVLIILLVFRHKIPSLVDGLASRVTKLEFPGFSLELAKAKPFIPEWSAAFSALDLRNKATAIQVNDSTVRTFLSQLTERSTADYAEINLGAGKEWLTTRLFIMSIVFARMKGIKCFVFVETFDNIQKRFIGWADPYKIRWALGTKYPWLEQAYAVAYSTILTQQGAYIVSHFGRLGYQFNPDDPGPSIELIRAFLQLVQSPNPPVPLSASNDYKDWVILDQDTNKSGYPDITTYEHASWISRRELEEILGTDSHSSIIKSTELRSKSITEQLKLMLSVPDRFVAVVADQDRFEYLIDRDIILEQVARRLTTEINDLS
jgi:hypothetical protein